LKKIAVLLIKKTTPLRQLLSGKIYIQPILQRVIVAQFHLLYYGSPDTTQNWKNTCWLGVPTMKCPFDLWIFQEIIHELRPERDHRMRYL